MTNYPLAPDAIAGAFVSACQGELTALKPGNVHIHAGGHDMEVRHFEKAAEAAAPAIAMAGASIGQRVRAGVEASFAAAGCNTNLGILLLCAPLAVAAGEDVSGGHVLPDRLSSVLSALGRGDAADVFAAIARANPGGLGSAEAGDVQAPADMSLLDAMRLAAGRDRIARAYVTDFEDVFAFALPLYRRALDAAQTRDLAVTTLHMSMLARFPDTHIARKYGPARAEEVQEEARELLPLVQPVATVNATNRLLEFDAALKARGLNPGTTADFVVATLFACQLGSSGC